MYRDRVTRYTCFTKEDIRKLQVLQNQVARLLVNGAGYNRAKKQNLSTEELLKQSGDLSVHQLGALHTLTLTKKIVLHQKPKYLAEKLCRAPATGTRAGQVLHQDNTSLGKVKEGFLSRGSTLYNLLPTNLKEEKNLGAFKKMAKNWIKSKIMLKV